MAQPDIAYRTSAGSNGTWNPTRRCGLCLSRISGSLTLTPRIALSPSRTLTEGMIKDSIQAPGKTTVTGSPMRTS